MAGRLWEWHRVGRLLRLALGLVAMAAAVVFIEPWIPVFFPWALLRRTAIGLLFGIKIAYGVVFVGGLTGSVVLTALVWQASRRGIRRPLAARGLLLCVACLISLACAEAIAAAWGAPPRSMPAVAESEPELPSRFPERDGQGTVNIVVIGESSAAGAPYEKWLSVGRIVAWQLGELLPERRFESIVLANSGDALETQYHKLAKLRCRPDVLIVYCGHNEFSARIPCSRRPRYYRDDGPSALESVNQRVLYASPLCGLIQRATDKFRIEAGPTGPFKPTLVDVPVFTPEEYAASLADFERRLETITAFAERVGALPVLVVPPANDAGFEPVRSFLPAETSRAEREAFAYDFRAARRLEGTSREQGIKAYRALLKRQPGFGECHYRLARLLENAGAYDEAYEHFIAARDLDGMPLRCVSAFQQVYRDVATAHDCMLVDGQALFHTIGPHGLLNDWLFNDVMHPSLRGHIALAQAVLDALRARRAFGWPSDRPVPAIEPARCAAHFGLDSVAWEAVCEGGKMFCGAVSLLMHDPALCRAKERAYAEAFRRIAAGAPPEALGLPNVGIPPELMARPVPKPAPDLRAAPVPHI